MINPKSHIIRKASWPMALMLFLVSLYLLPFSARCQNLKQDSIELALLCPLYLDSAFDQQLNFRFDKSIPNYMSPGMETYLGAMSAIDSLQKTGINITVHIIDTRSAGNNIEQLIKADALSNMKCIVAYVTLNESALLARYGALKKIPVVNLNLPNDGGTLLNSYYALLNPTLATHCKSIYQYIQQNYVNSTVLYFYKKGLMEDRIRSYYQVAAQSVSNKNLQLQSVFVEDSLKIDALKDLLDSTKHTICIIGSMESSFSLSLVKQLTSIRKTYPHTIIGMPNWEQVDFAKPMYKGAEIIFSTASYIRPENKDAQQIQKFYKEIYFTRTTDLMFRTYEAMLFIMEGLSLRDTTPLLEWLSKKGTSPWGGLIIKPVSNKSTRAIDFYENKNVFIVKKMDGVIKSVQ